MPPSRSAPSTTPSMKFCVGAYGLTTGSGIVEALVRAKQRGVDVRLIADKTTPCRRASGIGALAAVGVPIWIDAQPRIAHAKTMVIDGAVTLMGSFNWTTGAAQNSEDLNLVSSPTVAAAYAAHWRDASCRLGPVRSPRRLVLELTSRLARLFWEALDRADYAVTLVRCWAVDQSTDRSR